MNWTNAAVIKYERVVPIKEVSAMAAEIDNLVHDEEIRSGIITRSVQQAERLWTKKGIKESLVFSNL